MNKSTRISVFGKGMVVMACFFIFGAWLDPFHEKVEQGNQAYHSQKYDEAEKKYNEAEQHASGDEAKKILSFNKGVARYMSGDYEGAIELYKDAVASTNEDVRKKALFNMGNSYLKMNDKKSAFESYANALKVDPEYKAAAKNIEHLLKQQEEQNKKQNDGKNNKSKQDDKKTDDGQQKPQNDESQNQREMSREQVKNLLDSMKNKPAERSKGNGIRRNLEKNW